MEVYRNCGRRADCDARLFVQFIVGLFRGITGRSGRFLYSVDSGRKPLRGPAFLMPPLQSGKAGKDVGGRVELTTDMIMEI